MCENEQTSPTKQSIQCRSCRRTLEGRETGRFRIRGFGTDYSIRTCSQCRKVKIVYVERVIAESASNIAL